MPRLILFLICSLAMAAPQPPVYLMLWFDTEDYLQPAADDAALRIANDLERLGVRATFKVVGEKARVLEKRGRYDVIRALSHHDIGYHSNFHSVQPTPALYLKEMGWLEGAAEFERREKSGARDVQRVFGILPSCYGQPGSSWGPQSYPALLRMGIPVYLDEGTQVGIEDQPFWFGGMLNVFNMGAYAIRPNLDDEAALTALLVRFDHAVAELRARGGGVISTYFHPTEFISAKFWDAVNFTNGANPDRSQWRLQPMHTPADAEKRFQIMLRYVEHARNTPGLRFATAREVPQLYKSAHVWSVNRSRIAAHMAARQTFLVSDGVSLSAADMLLALLGIEARYVDGPSEPGRTTAGRIEHPAIRLRTGQGRCHFVHSRQRPPAGAGLDRLADAGHGRLRRHAGRGRWSVTVDIRAQGQCGNGKIRSHRSSPSVQLDHSSGRFPGRPSTGPGAPASLDIKARNIAIICGADPQVRAGRPRPAVCVKWRTHSCVPRRHFVDACRAQSRPDS